MKIKQQITHFPWEKYYTRPTRTQDFEFFVVKPILFFKGSKIKESLYVPTRGKWEGWYPAADAEITMKKVAESIFQNSWTAKKHLKDFQRDAKKMKQAAIKLARLSKKASYSKLLSAYEDLTNACLNYGNYIWLPLAITRYLEGWFVKRLQKFFDWRKMYEVLARSSRAIKTQQMVEAVWSWKAKAGNQRDLDKIVNKYAYLGGYSVNDNVWTKKDILIQVGSLKNPLEKMKMARAARRKNKIAQQKLIIKLASRDKMLAKAAQAINLYVWLRTERVDSYKETMFFIRPFYRRLEKDFSWKFGWAGNLSYDEIVNILKKGQAPLAAELEKRNRLQYLAHITKQKTIIIADVNRRNRYLNILMGKSRQTDVKLIKGQIAYPGIVRGKVRIILDASKARLVKKNEILVANMTHPDYLVGIRKAAAIVTDEGGILCHASIISRELKIPCIIGTKIATKVLHDGNLVEVDADKGIVKKIK